MGQNSKKDTDDVNSVSGSSSFRSQSGMDQMIWSTLPDDMVLSILANLSWDEITNLSHIWRKLSEALINQPYLEEFAAGRLQKPICVLEGTLPQDLKYRMVAGDGHNKCDALVFSKEKLVKTLNDSIRHKLLVTANDSLLALSSAGCFVLVEYVDYVPIVPRSPSDQSFAIVMNPTNGTATQICLPDNMQRHLNCHLFCLCGIFIDAKSEYQILARFYERNQNGEFTYMRSLPKEERLGQLYDGTTRHPEGNFYYGAFYLYNSRTKSWTNLVGSNMAIESVFRDPLLYRGTIHALFISNLVEHCTSVSTIYQVCYVEEISGRTRWIPLAVPLPSPTLFFAHLFVFQGMLMLVAGVPTLPGSKRRLSNSRLRSVCIWRLHEESRTWIEVSSMPDAIVQDVQACASDPHFHNFPLQSCYTNGDYMMLVARGYKACQYSMVMFNIATSHWQIIQKESSQPYIADKRFALFEPRLDISA